MINLRLVIGIVVILALVCSPTIAFSKSDLIAQYKGQSASTIPTVVPTTIPTSTPKPIPTPTPITTSDINPFAELSVSSTPTGAMVFIDGFLYEGRTPVTIRGLSVGTHQLKVFRVGYEDYSTEVVIPEPECISWYGMTAWASQTQTIDVTLKKVESTLKPTIPIIIPTTAPTQMPIPTHYIYPWMVSPTTAPTPTPSHTPCPPGVPYCFLGW